MRNWSYTIVLSCIVVIIACFATERVNLHHILDDLTFVSVFTAIGKTLIVSFVLYFAAIISFPALVIDLVLLIFTTRYFFLLGYLWNLVWTNFTLPWYWNAVNGNSLVIGAFILAIITHFGIQRT